MSWDFHPWKLKGLDHHMALLIYVSSHRESEKAELVETLFPFLTLEETLNLVMFQAFIVPSFLSRSFGNLIVSTHHGSQPQACYWIQGPTIEAMKGSDAGGKIICVDDFLRDFQGQFWLYLIATLITTIQLIPCWLSLPCIPSYFCFTCGHILYNNTVSS